YRSIIHRFFIYSSQCIECYWTYNGFHFRYVQHNRGCVPCYYPATWCRWRDGNRYICLDYFGKENRVERTSFDYDRPKSIPYFRNGSFSQTNLYRYFDY